MNVFSVLFATCILGLCHCKNSRYPGNRLIIEVLDDYTEDETVNYYTIRETRGIGSSGNRLVWDLASGTVYEAEYTQPSARRRNTGKVKDVALEEPKTKTRSRRSSTLDIAKPDRSEYRSFYYHFSGNAMQLVVSNKGVSVKKLVDGGEKIWIPSSEETFRYARTYLNKNKEPEFVILVFNTPSGISRKDYMNTENGWKPCINSDAKIKNPAAPIPFKSNFELDLSASRNTKECRIFEVAVLGVTTRHFYPKPGNVAMKVKDGTNALWTAKLPSPKKGNNLAPSKSNACLFCLVYKHGNKEVLEIVTVEKDAVEKKYFEKVGGTWNMVNRNVFLNQLKEMKGVSGLAFLDPTSPFQSSK